MVWLGGCQRLSLVKAGITVGMFQRGADAHGTVNMLYDRSAFFDPNGEPTNGEPLAGALKKAGIDCTLLARMPIDIGGPLETPMIIIGGRFSVPPEEPYLGPPAAEPTSTK
jgi:hypothetical protein